MEKTRKWRKILAMMLTVVMMLQNAQSVMVFADVTNEQIEQRLAGNQGQTEETQPAQSQVDTRANGEEYKTQSQEMQENGNGSTDIGSPESGNATTEAKTSKCRCICNHYPERVPGGCQWNHLQLRADDRSDYK